MTPDFVHALRVGIDAITPGASLGVSAGGMRTYVTALTRSMSTIFPRIEFVVLESKDFPLTELEGLPNVKRIVGSGRPLGRVGRILYQNTVLPVFLRSLQLDVLLATCNVLPLGCPVPTVVVVQSLQFFDHTQAYGHIRGAYLRWAVRHACRHGEALICVSNAARRDLIRHTGVEPHKLRVIHHGISPLISDHIGKSQPAEPPYILCVATLYRYKNISRLLQAFALLKKGARLPYRLRIIGAEADMTIAELRLEARRLQIDTQVDFIGPIAHALMGDQYSAASVFVYPSLYETFGHPPLEAMRLGIPVVSSRSSSIPEIVGEAAELVDPLDVPDIARGLSRVLFEPGRAESLVQDGRLRAQQFTWEAAARQTMALLQHTARGREGSPTP